MQLCSRPVPIVLLNIFVITVIHYGEKGDAEYLLKKWADEIERHAAVKELEDDISLLLVTLQ